MTVRIIARCVHGVEWACADEVSARFPQATGLELARREITFALPAVHPGLLELSTVDDVFLLVGGAGGVGTTKQAPADAARRLARLPWERAADQVRELRPVAAAPQLDVVASLEGRRTFNRFAMEQAIGVALEPVLGAGYLLRTAAGRAPGEPDLMSFAAITDEPPAEVAAAGHDRCIIPIRPKHVDAWLNPDPVNLAAQHAILDDRARPFYEHRMAA